MRKRPPTPEEALAEYRSITALLAIERGKIGLANELSSTNWHLDRVDAGVREPDEPEPGPALDFGRGLPPPPTRRGKKKKTS